VSLRQVYIQERLSNEPATNGAVRRRVTPIKCKPFRRINPTLPIPTGQSKTCSAGYELGPQCHLGNSVLALTNTPFIYRYLIISVNNRPRLLTISESSSQATVVQMGSRVGYHHNPSIKSVPPCYVRHRRTPPPPPFDRSIALKAWNLGKLTITHNQKTYQVRFLNSLPLRGD
jgi:hypothetical protein